MGAGKRKLNNEDKILKTTNEVRLSKLLASQEAIRQDKAATITLKDFIRQNYHFDETDEAPTAFKCTIKDIGLAPFEIDVFDARIILVEVTGKMRKDFDGNEVPERLYKGRNYSINGTLNQIADMMARRKIMGGESTVITLRDYHNAYQAYYRYIVGVINKDYTKALDALQDKFPFTQISEGRSDEEK